MEQLNLEDWPGEASSAEPKPKTIKDDETDCPMCGGSGPCYACQRGRETMAEFKSQKKKKPRKKVA